MKVAVAVHISFPVGAEEDGSVFCWGAGEIFQLKQKQVTESVENTLNFYTQVAGAWKH